MARRAARMTRVFVLDTSYLAELYSVPGFSDAAFSRALKNRMEREVGARFHVPVGCLYKLCDHIADVGDGNRRHQLARQVAVDVKSSIGRSMPWLMSPATGLDGIAEFVQRFAFNPEHLKIGLTNSEVIEIANALKRKYGTDHAYRVHIWTRNRRLKAHEPDPEPEPL